MSYFAAVNGLQIVSGRLLIPDTGLWTADLQLAGAVPLSGVATVVIGNLTLVGSVYRSSAYGGQVSARLVGGAGGWRTVIPAQGYGNAGGVKLSTILGDAASACGETISVNADSPVGNAFTRLALFDAVASDVLQYAVDGGYISGWYVDPTGTTQTGDWPAETISTPFTVTDQRPDEGVIVVATEDYASWMPGCQFAAPQLSGTYTSAGVHYVWTPDGQFRFEVLTETPTLTTTAPPVSTFDRFLGAIEALVRRLIAPTRFYARYNYTVSNPTLTTVDLTPINAKLGLPDLQNVPITADALASFIPGTGRAHVQFLDGDRAQPVCVWCEADSTSGPGTITFAPSVAGALAIARISDTVIVQFPPAMQISGLQGLPVPTEPFVAILTCTTPAVGQIVTGSSQASTP
jgi:thiol-disulfide isomerase/thioredoxin